MKKKIIKKITQYKYQLLIIALALIICSPFTVDGWYNNHDGCFHLARAYGTTKALVEDGQFPPEITSSFVEEFGYSWNLFYPPLGGYVIAIMKLISFNYITATKLAILLFVAIAGICMFYLMKDILKKDKASFITSVIYITSIYFISDVYIRLNIGEIMAFAFLPMLFRGLHNVFYNDGKKHYWIVIGAVGIALSHNISTLASAIISVLYVIYGFVKNRKNIEKIYSTVIIDVLVIILMVAFFYVPFIEAIISTKYRVMLDGFMATKESLISQSLYIYQLLFGKAKYGWSSALSKGINNEISFSIGIHILVPLLLTPFVYKKIDSKYKKAYIMTLGLGIIFALMSTNVWPWEYMGSLFKIIQFPWRMLLIATVLLTIITGVNISKIIDEKSAKDYFIIVLIILMYVSQIIPQMIQFDNNWSEDFIYSTELNMKNCGGNFEYLPAQASPIYIKNREKDAIVISGNATIESQNKKGTKMKMEIKEVSEPTEIELPYIYYPGYSAEINGRNINVDESENGFALIKLNQNDTGIVNIEYKGTLLQKISTTISIIACCCFIVWLAIVLKNT